jgi:hypothetical protein
VSPCECKKDVDTVRAHMHAYLRPSWRGSVYYLPITGDLSRGSGKFAKRTTLKRLVKLVAACEILITEAQMAT